MLHDVVIRGDLTTHDLASGAPYYMIQFSDSSEAVAGTTSLVIHRDASPDFIESPRVAAVLAMAKELESLTGGRTPLRVEFVQTRDGLLHLLQVRRIAVQRNWNRTVRTRLSQVLKQLELFLSEHSKPRHGIAGDSTILGQMPDWNATELVGEEPGALSLSLFRHLISDTVWQEARSAMGYRPVTDEALVVSIAGRPYIDVRASFCSFLPDGLPERIQHELINAWLERLADHPEYHDKVEFEVAQTVFDFTFERNLFQRYAGHLNPHDQGLYVDEMRALTLRNVTSAQDGPLLQSLRRIEMLDKRLADWPLPSEPLRKALGQLKLCRQYGTRPFAMIARHAFMAEALLRSAVERGAWSSQRLEEFKASLVSPATLLSLDFQSVLEKKSSSQEFLRRYGHLRPGTFDILSPRYDQMDALLREGLGATIPAAGTRRLDFALYASEKRDFDKLLKEVGLPITPEELCDYAAQAIVGREHSRFVFSRPLSDALENIAEWGESIGLTREDLAFLSVEDLQGTLSCPVTRDRETYFHELAQARRNDAREMEGLRLGYLIRGAQDLYVVPEHKGGGNFVTSKDVEADVVCMAKQTDCSGELYHKVVCVECADAGFDWIFTRGIAGLITKHGGANSYMTVRCTELGIPAVIGIGEGMFRRLSQSARVELKCSAKALRVIN